MEKDATWIPLTPGKPISATVGYRHESALTSEKGIIKEIINVAFPCVDLFDTTRYMEKSGMNETDKLPASILDEHEAVFGAAVTEPEKTALGQDDTSCVQEEAVKVPSRYDGKKVADGFDESLGSVPTPSKTEDTRKRRNNGIDLNKKPSQRPRVKKHRPKIFDDSKPKNVPKAQTPKGTTPRPKKTQKPATPNRVQEKRASSKHNKNTGLTDCTQISTSHGHVDGEQVVQEASRDSLIVVKPCKRYLDFDSNLVVQESHNVSKIQEPGRPFLNLEIFYCLGKIVTSKRNTPRKSRFPKKSHQASEDSLGSNDKQKHEQDFCDTREQASENLLGGNDKQKHEQDFCITREEEAGKSSSKYVYFYQRRKKINSKVISYTPTVQVYRRTFRENNCFQSSKKSGPNFPKIFKKRRTLRKKANIGWWCVDRVEDGHGNGKRSLRKCIQATGKRVQISVDKSKDQKRSVKKPAILRGEWLKSIFSPPRRKRSIRHIRRRGNNKDFLNSSRMPYDDDTYLKCQEESSLQNTEENFDIDLRCKEENFLQITDSPPLQDDYLDINREEENFLQITDSIPLHEVPVHRIESFTSRLHRIESFTSRHHDVQQIDDFVCGLNCFQLQEVPMSQSLVPRYEDTEEDRTLCAHLYAQNMTPYLIAKFASLDINGQCKKPVARDPNTGRIASLDTNDQCKELVVRDEKVSGAIVKAAPTKKRKVLPKVDLDNETLRVWKLLMENDGSEQLEEMDKDKDEWWDRQREIFRGRVDSFIAKMHLIQGDRRFSPWKGSVVDSVAGVYLTQNVSDHLSSSAFMSVAARFPVKPRSKEADDYFGEVATRKETVTCYTKVDEDLCKNNEMEQNVITSCADAILTTEPQQDVVSNPILTKDGLYANENSNTFRNLLEVEEEDFLKQYSQESVASNNKGDENLFKNNEIEQNKSNSCAEFGSQESVTSITKNCEDLFKNNEMIHIVSTACADVTPTTGPQQDMASDSIPAQDKPCVNANSNTSGTLLGVQEVDYPKQFCRSDINESSKNESRVNWDLNTSIIEGEEQTAVSCDVQISSEASTAMSDVNVGLSETLEREIVGQQESTHVEEPKVITPVSSLECVLTIAQGVNDVNNHPGMTEILVETRSTGKKKSKIEKKQEPKIDWEALRKTYCKSGRKETDENSMDAVDWDAVRRAPVEELAKVIAERGMSNVLAGRIKDFLDRVYQDHGAIDLEWLRDLPPDTAKEFLLSIDGIGLKSVECVRLLTLHHLAFPVDTNVGRVATRLGWVPLQPLPGDVPIHLLNAYPMVDNIQKYLFPRLCTLDQRTLYELHYQLITFGKVFCTKVKPNCNACPMRAECRHYASAVASGRLKLPGPKEGSHVTSIVPAGNEQNYSVFGTPPSIIDLEVNKASSSYYGQNCEPIIEVPQSPVPEVEDKPTFVDDIEDLFCESDDEIPTIRLNTEEFRETLKDTIDANNIPLSEGDMSKTLVSLSAEAATFRMPQVKYIARLRTLHVVCELPDFHPCLSGFDEREHDDPSPYLLKIWLPGEIPNSLGYTENRVCDFASNNHEETVKATVLIPCRTANRGTFPLNGTYFQVNEVFADDETTNFPMDVPRSLVRNLPTRELGCGSSATSIFRALPTGIIQRLFWRGSICVRGFNRKTRKPHPLHRRFHISTAAIAAENKKLGKN